VSAASAGDGGSIELPGHGSCFICGSENRSGLGIVFRLRDGRVRTRFTLDERQQGPPRHAHGGCLSSVLDEAMGAAVWCAGHPVVAARLEIDFRRAVPLGRALEVEAWVTAVDGRKVWAESELRFAETGEAATRGKGLFIEKPELFDGNYFVPRM
jgi:acyl-coenzyme A thioesterase PaaI-like protein